MKQMKQILSFLLVVSMVVGFVPTGVLATEVPAEPDTAVQSVEGFVSETHDVFSSTTSTIAPGVTQSINYAYAKDGKQMVYYVATADIAREDVEVHTSYKGAQCAEFGMDKLTNQMAAADAKYTDSAYEHYNPYFQSVAGINGDFYNMSTGQPSGAFVMEGVMRSNKANNRPWFAIFADGTALCGYNNSDWDAAVAAHGEVREAVGGSQVLVMNGKDVTASASGSYNTDRHSRTMVGVTADGQVVFGMLDGRQEPFSCGGTMHELAQIMLEQGCVMAINLDGGGSATYAARPEGENEVKVINRPSDGSERSISSGLLIASTAVPSDVFERAVLTPAHSHVTPWSEVEVAATGVSPAGTAAEIPADVSWQMADDSMGDVVDGLFWSNGTEGDAVVQMVYEGNVVGETVIHVVVPTALEYTLEEMTAPFGKTIEILPIATCNNGLNTVKLKEEDIEFVLSDPTAGTVEGFFFTAAEEGLGAESTQLTATVVGTDVSVTVTIKMGKASEVLWDFEDGDVSDWARHNKANYNYILTPGEVSLATAEDGKVHSGEYALRAELDFSASMEGGYISAMVGLNNEEVIDLGGATRLGMWVYFPYEAKTLNGRIYLREVTARDENGNIVSYATSTNTTDATLDGSSEKDWSVGFITSFEESGWHYISFDLTQRDLGFCIAPKGTLLDIYVNDRDSLDKYGFNHLDYMSCNQKVNLYIDDVTLDYSSAVDDREAPIFSSLNWANESMSDAISIGKGKTAVSDMNKLSFNAVVSENTRQNNYSGLDESTVKAYVDGVEVPFTFANGIISVSDVVLADGEHTVKFSVCDKMGNYASIIRQIRVQAGSNLDTVKLLPRDASLDKILMGSLYWVDVVATAAEKVQTISMDLDLNNMSVWELDHMEVAKGFEATYEITDVDDNIATLTVTRTGDTELTGEAAIVSMPIRTWQMQPVVQNGTGKGRIWMYPNWKNGNELWPIDINVQVRRGQVTFLDGTEDVFSGEKVQVDTEIDSWFYNDTAARDEAYKTWNGGHDHRVEMHQYYAENATNKAVPVALEDKDATCTEDGYTGRTFCEVCNSVAVWGETIPATGHSYTFVDGVLMCHCGETHTGIWSDGKTYAQGVPAAGWVGDSYYLDGVKLTGICLVDGYYYDFGEDGVCADQSKYTGLFYDQEAMVYRYALFGELETGWRMLGDAWYYFDAMTEAALVGTHTLMVDGVALEYTFEENGKLTSDIWYTNANNEMYRYYGPGHYTRVWKEIDGKTYFINWRGVAARGIYGIQNSPHEPEIFYLFDFETCALIAECGGFMTYNGNTYYHHTQGSNAVAYGLWCIDGYYYYFSTSTGAMRTGDYTVISYNSNGLLNSNRTFHFDETHGYAVDKNGNPLTSLEEDVPDGGYPMFVEREGKTYYYLNENGLAFGFHCIDGKYYYFSTSTGAMRTGDYTVQWYTSNGLLDENRMFHFDETYGYAVDKNGEPLTSLEQETPKEEFPKFVERSGKTYYYFSANAMAFGFRCIDGKYYYFSTSTGAMRTGTYTVMSYTSNGLLTGNRTFHFDETHGYAVNEKGEPLTTLEQETPEQDYPKFVERNGETYYYLNENALAFGFHCIEGKYYYFSTSTGAMRTGMYTVQWYTSNGLLTENRTFHFDEAYGYAVDENGAPVTSLN